jgi:hypothetical protein
MVKNGGMMVVEILFVPKNVLEIVGFLVVEKWTVGQIRGRMSWN